MNSPNSVLHELYEQRNLQKYRAFLSGTTGGNSSQNSAKGKQSANNNSSSNNNGGSYPYGAGGGSSLSRSPRFGFSHGNDGIISKEELNARDRQGRTVLHLVVTDGGIPIEPISSSTSKGKKPASSATRDKQEKPSLTSLEYLEPLLQCHNLNVNLQDKENGWTALHRAVYAGNLVAARRLLQHSDIDTAVRDLEGLTAFELLNSTILGTKPSDSLENLSPEAEDNPRRELVTWGANRNFVLGLQGDSDRTFPERVILERTLPSIRNSSEANSKSEESFEPLPVRKIAMEKLHSGLLTDEKRNNFRLCGFGSTTGRLGHASQHPQFAFEPLRDFAQQAVVDFALGQDHTVLCTDKGDAWTFGLNTFSVLGYPVESTTPSRPGLAEDPVQATPKRLVGILKKEFVIGVAASRYHTVVYTADSLFTWGKNNGQLGYPALATPIQHTPRKVTTLTQPVIQVCATEAATVCLLEGGEVFVLHRDGHFKISFPATRFSSTMQVYRPPNVSSRPTIFKVAGSGTTFIALSSLGDVFSWQLDNPSLEAPASALSSGRDIKPTRIWEDKRTFTAVTDAAVAGDTIILSTRSGHVYVRSRKKELNTVKGFDLRSSGSVATGGGGNAKKGQYKFTRIANLQRVVNVAVSSSGGFAAIRSDAPLLHIDEVGDGLPASLLGLLPHYRRLQEEELKDAAVQGGHKQTASLLLPEDVDDDEDESIEQDKVALNKICRILLKWDSAWSISGASGSDILVVAGASGIKVPAHITLLAARSTVLAEALQGRPSNGVSVSRVGATTLSLPKCSHVTVLLLLHYLYSDSIPAIYDPRLFQKIQSTYPALQLQVGNIKNELHSLASALQLPALTQALRAYGKADPTATLAGDLTKLSDDANAGDVILETAGKDFSCHSVVLRARCPFFAAMFDDPDWYAPRTDSDDDNDVQALHIDLKHIGSDIMQIVLRHLYTDADDDLLDSKEFTRIDEKLDYLMLIMSAANELLLDRLKAICSSIVRPLINMQTVCSILCEAIFYEAANLQECCMQYICCNIETMLEQRLLDILPIYALTRLTEFCGRKQLERLPKTGRSGIKLAELRLQHGDWLKTLDSGRITGSYRKYSRQYSAKSPRLSPATFSSSLRLSPNLSSSPTLVLSPPPRQAEIPSSPSPSVSPAPSPLVEATNADDEDLFDMDDLKLDDTDVPTPTRLPSPAPQMYDSTSFPILSPPSITRVPWQRPAQLSSTPPRSLRDIMSQASTKASTSTGRLAENHPVALNTSSSPVVDSPIAFSLRLSQRDRKRQQQSLLGQQAVEAAAAPTTPSSPWKPAMPAAWKPPDMSAQRPSLSSIQSSQAVPSSPVPGSLSSPALPGSLRRISSPASTSASPAGTPVKQSPLQPINPASAVGAPVITPTRAQPKRNISDSGGPPERRSSDKSWVNYTSTIAAPAIYDDAPGTGQSFATIQNLQATEREAIRGKKGAMSLAEIQEEENTRREEAAFLAWFEEESKRTQADSNPPPPAARGGRGGSRGRGRGEGKSRGGGGQRGRGRGSGANTPKKGPPVEQ